MNKNKYIRKKIKGALRMVKYLKSKKDLEGAKYQEECAQRWITLAKESK
jgi:hypothetical protein